jgi:hypothetical protein
MIIGRRWGSGPRRLRLRRKLLAVSAPFAFIIVIGIAKTVSVLVAGSYAQSAYASRDSATLETAVSILEMFNIIEPAKASFAAGTLAVLEDRLSDADAEFSKSLLHVASAESCPARVDLALVREAMGDRAAATFELGAAVDRYFHARLIVEQAPPGCFAGNQDANQQRRAVREDALRRLNRKITAAQTAPPPPAAAPTPPETAPPRLQPGGSSHEKPELRLDPGSTPPLDRLQQILRDAAGEGWS